jgi:hypothetical protein
LVGDSVTFGPANNCVTPPFKAVVAVIALVAQLEVPNKDPVNDPENKPLPPCAKLEVKAKEAVPAN